MNYDFLYTTMTDALVLWLEHPSRSRQIWLCFLVKSMLHCSTYQWLSLWVTSLS